MFKRFAACIAIGITLGTAVWLLAYRLGPVVPASITGQVPFPVYAPASLPRGYSVDRRSVRYENGLVTYSLASPLGLMVVTQQRRPDGFKADQLGDQGFDELQPFTVTIGPAMSGKQQGRMVGLVFAPQTLISVNGPAGLSRESMQVVLAALRGL